MNGGEHIESGEVHSVWLDSSPRAPRKEVQHRDAGTFSARGSLQRRDQRRPAVFQRTRVISGRARALRLLSHNGPAAVGGRTGSLITSFVAARGRLVARIFAWGVPERNLLRARNSDVSFIRRSRVRLCLARPLRSLAPDAGLQCVLPRLRGRGKSIRCGHWGIEKR